MRVYISGSWTERPRMRQCAEILRARGHRVISSWLDEQDKPAEMPTVEWLRRLAVKDVAEVAASDILVMDVDGASTTGGRYVEWGVACHPHALIQRVLIGTPPTLDVFGKMADHHFKTWAEFLDSGII